MKERGWRKKKKACEAEINNNEWIDYLKEKESWSIVKKKGKRKEKENEKKNSPRKRSKNFRKKERKKERKID